MKKIFFITALVVVSFLFFYFVFYFLLIKFNVDSRLTRKMSEFIPVPVAVSKKGFVEYYDFIDISNNVYKKNSNQDEVKKIIYEEIAKIIILKNIIKEYKLDGDFSDEKIKEKINSVLLSERNINLDDYLKNEISNFKILVFIK